jgi:signal transduction histidine kinase
VAPEAIQVGPLLADVAAGQRPNTEGRAVRLDAADDLWVRADYGLLVQALGNLVENAGRYSRPGGAILLRAERGGDFVRISVYDEGPGIPSEDLPHVFEKFYRGSQALQTKGTGLGLAIARAMIELNGGSLDVRSSEAGAVFTAVLPAAEDGG